MTLSDKRMDLTDYEDSLEWCYDEEDVKEFIKKLKEWETSPEFHYFIDKLAGKELI